MSSRLERYKPLLWLLGIVLAGVAVVALVRQAGQQGAPLQAPPAATAAADSQPRPAGTAAPAQGAGAPPPWVGNAPAGTAAAATAARQRLVQDRPVPTRAELERALEQIRTKTEQNDRAADEMLRQLDQLQASGQLPAHVDANALRANLQLAKRSQALSRELAELALATPSQANQARIQAIVGELQQLQGQLRYDVRAAGAPAVLGGQ